MNRQETKPPRTVFFHDERTDDFAGVSRKTPVVDASFPYLPKNPIWRLASFAVYRLIMTPFAYLYCKLRFGLRVVNRRAIRSSGRQGAFVYGNHTLLAGDAFIPSLVSFPRKTHVVVHADNLAVPATRGFIRMCGAIPVPTKLSGMRAFSNALEKRNLQRHTVQIYPEAHIWPYYTGIRPFESTSFHYPVAFGAAAYAATTTYQKRRIGRTPRVTVYVDGPFYPDASLPPRERERELRDRIYGVMVERAAEHSTYSPVRYVREEGAADILTKEREATASDC